MLVVRFYISDDRLGIILLGSSRFEAVRHQVPTLAARRFRCIDLGMASPMVHLVSLVLNASSHHLDFRYSAALNDQLYIS